MKNYRIFICIIFTFFTTILFGLTRNVRFNNISIDDGLSNNRVQCIVQDDYGFLWFGTENGLNRYDGYTFKIYKFDQRDKYSLTHNNVNSLLEDSKNNLWIGTNQGLNLYDRQNDRFIQDPKWPINTIKAIAEDEENNLWIGTYEGIYYLDFKKDTIVNYTINKTVFDNGCISSPIINSILVDSENNVWIGTPQGINLFDKRTNTFKNYYHKENDPHSLSANRIKPILEDSKGRIWIGTEAGIDLFTNAKDRPEKGKFIHIENKDIFPKSTANGIVRILFEDNECNVWVGNKNGLSVLDLNLFESGITKFNYYTNGPSNKSNLSNSEVYSFLQDKHGVFWIGFRNAGIDWINTYEKAFSHVTSIPGSTNTLSHNQVNEISEDGDDLWIGTEYGLNRYNKKNKTYKHYYNDPSVSTSIGQNSARAICKDKSGNILVGGWASGLNILNPKTEIFSHYYHDPENPNSISNNNVYSIFEDSMGNIWIATWGGGVNMFNPQNEDFTFYNAAISSIPSNYCYGIIESKDKSLWIGTTGGVTRFDPSENKFELFKHNINDSNSLSDNDAIIIFEDSKENIWVGTDAGLNVMQKSKATFKHYMESDGLPDNSIRGILEDKHGNLWISTNRGLSKFINAVNLPSKPKFRNYFVEDGIQGNDFRHRSCFIGADGIMYFGGNKGFNMFYPDSIKDNPIRPDVVFIDFSIFSLPVEIGAKDSPLQQDISVTKEIQLSYKQSVFGFKFTALNYISSEKNQYAYIMEGFEDSWNYVGTKREATYMNLKHGAYTFRVKASNNDGIWNNDGASIKITILPPWWKTLWFKLFIGLFIIGVFVYMVLSIILRIKRLANQTILNERNQLKTLINNIPDRIVIKDNKSRFLIVNNSGMKFLGINSEKEIVNKTDYDYFLKEEADYYYNQEKEIISTGIPIINVEEKRIKNNQELYVSTTKCPIINTNAETIGLISIVRDINIQKRNEIEIVNKNNKLIEVNSLLNETNTLLEERQQQIEEQAVELKTQAEVLNCANDELHKSNATKDKLFSIIAHDIINPFSSVLGFSELLIMRFDSLSEEHKLKMIKSIYTSSNNIYRLLENLLQWSRSQTGTLKTNPENISISKIVENNIGFLSDIVEKKNIEWHNDIPTDQNCFADEHMIDTVIRNILYNATKFTENGSISIKSEVKESYLKIFISDTGIGIEEDKLEYLFEVYQSKSTVGTQGEQGTGLGLIICKDFIEKNGGNISVESEVNKGTTFIFTLPIKDN